jgi:hypothetical protein
MIGSREFRDRYEGVSLAIGNMKTVLSITDSIVNDHAMSMTPDLSAKLSFLIETAEQLASKADGGMRDLWVAAGGKDGAVTLIEKGSAA